MDEDGRRYVVIHFGVDHHLLEDVLVEKVGRTPELKEVLAAVTTVHRVEKLRKKNFFSELDFSYRSMARAYSIDKQNSCMNR